ncbi:MAG: alanine--tRNA ligase [Lachnospiraceae bacterium]|nr:alanine--tRNA ligase [Lachnospiraceae bacterium]
MNKYYGVNELREMYLKFFEEKGHLRMKSFSLVPHNDNSLLIINSGMAPLKPYFTGQEIPPRRRVTTCQKCIRTPDIDNIGKTARHGTFFEMLGNFSFGDYFKHEAIAWSWEFLTEVVGLEADRLYPSVYVDDDEAFEIWNKEIGIPAERIYRFGKEDNFWEHGSGPCGPCSEIYYDRGEKYGTGPEDVMGGEGDRFMEVWNNVFSQFNNDGHGNYTELIQKNIDTGMGLERLAVAVQDVDSLFDVDTIRALRDHVCRLAGKEYHKDYQNDVSIRIITDHIRSATFMISDGIMPSNEGRGYVLRRLIRRAARNGRLLGINGMFLAELSSSVIEGSKGGYPELEEKKDFIFKVLNQEETQFNKTIDQGLGIIAKLEQDMAATGSTQLSGADAFKLYDTYGFPLDLTREILAEKNITIDEEGFTAAMKEQKDAARKARKGTSLLGREATVYDEMPTDITSEFDGYDKLSLENKISILTVDGEEGEDAQVADAISEGQSGSIIVTVTPFYATMGGQIGDRGVITGPDGEFTVTTTEKVTGGRIAHIGKVTRGMLKTGDTVTLKVDEANRKETCKNHSATHLLQKALRMVLGSHVEQKGSYNDEHRLRFDFSHFQAMTAEELAKVEDIVNEKIAEGIAVKTDVMTLEEAKKTGAMALFGEKYGEKVRVVSMSDFSVEFCGGTHVSNTQEIRAFKIVSETGVAAGVRRIEALTDSRVFAHYDEQVRLLEEAAAAAKTTPANLSERISHLLAEIKALQSENESLKSHAAKDALGDVMDRVQEISGVKFLAASVPGVDMNGLRDLGDSLKEKLGEGVILLASAEAEGGKVSLVAMATEEAQKKGASAGNLIKAIAPIVGGGGGGRPNMAQAGGKNPAGIDEALAKAAEVLKEQIK